MSPDAAIVALQATFRAQRADRIDGCYELRLDPDVFTLTVAGGRLDVERGPATGADAARYITRSAPGNRAVDPPRRRPPAGRTLVTVRRPSLPADMPRDVFTMGGVAFCVALGFGVVGPAIPLFAQQFGVNQTAAGAVVSAFALLRLICGPGAGKLVGVLGVRTSLLIGLGVVAISSLLAGLAESYDQLLILRGVGGAGSALFGVAAISIVLRAATEHIRGRAMSIYRAGFLTGGIVGPGIGGAMLGWSLRAPFFLYAGTLAASAVVAIAFLTTPARRGKAAPTAQEPDPLPGAERGLPATEGVGDPQPASEPVVPPDREEAGAPPAASRPVVQVSVRQALRTREYQAAVTSNLAIGLTLFGLRSTIVPLLIVDELHAAAGWVGVALLFSAIVETALMFPAGRWSDRAGRRTPLVAGSFVAAAAMLMLGMTHSLTVVLIAMTVFGAGSALLGTVPAALVGDAVGGGSGLAIAVFNMASDLGTVAGPVLAGYLVTRGSYFAAFAIGAAVIVASGIAGLRLPRHAGAAGPAAASTSPNR